MTGLQIGEIRRAFYLSHTHIPCGSGLARDAGDEICQESRGDAIASKPTPTEIGVVRKTYSFLQAMAAVTCRGFHSGYPQAVPQALWVKNHSLVTTR